MPYLAWDSITTTPEDNITDLYDKGYVFTRKGKGEMDKTRSLRINLNKFKLTSENRRVLKKTDNWNLSINPLPVDNYDWKIGKLGKDFYDTKFGKSTFSANKIKELLTDPSNSNFNKLFTYSTNNLAFGYAICYENQDIIHYSYPFYTLEEEISNMGMGMMLQAIQYADNKDLKYVYLGSLQRPTDTYKLQFKGLEWFDGKKWLDDIDKVKEILKKYER